MVFGLGMSRWQGRDRNQVPGTQGEDREPQGASAGFQVQRGWSWVRGPLPQLGHSLTRPGDGGHHHRTKQSRSSGPAGLGAPGPSWVDNMMQGAPGS